jgi:hypothetical protein
MQFILSWIRRKKLKFFILDYFLLIINILILNIIQNGFFINIDLIAGFLAANIMLGFIFFIYKIWMWFTKRYPFLFIEIKGVGKILAYFGMAFFVIINIVFIFLIWIYNDFKLIFYFAMPWVIIIFADIYNSILSHDSIVKNWDGSSSDSEQTLI